MKTRNGLELRFLRNLTMMLKDLYVVAVDKVLDFGRITQYEEHDETRPPRANWSLRQ